MPVIVLEKRNMPVLYPNKQAVLKYFEDTGKNINDYEILYAYKDMQRSKYPPSYKEAHRKAARAYYHRKRAKDNGEKI